MKVKELIEQLQTYNEDLEVRINLPLIAKLNIREVRSEPFRDKNGHMDAIVTIEPKGIPYYWKEN